MLGGVIYIIPVPQFSDLGLTMRAALPAHLWALVTTDMNIFAREQRADLTEHILQKLQCAFLTDAEYILGDTPPATHFIRSTRTSQLRIGRQSRKHVTRKVDLRNHLYASCRSIIQDLLHLLMRVPHPLTVRSTIIAFLVGPASYYGLPSDSTFLSQFGIFLYLDSPALVIGKMPMEGIEFMKGHQVKISLHLLHIEEMAGHIQMQSPVGKPRLVLYFDTWKRPVSLRGRHTCINLHWQHLLKGLHCINNTFQGRCLNRDLFVTYGDGIFFVRHFRGLLKQKGYACTVFSDCGCTQQFLLEILDRSDGSFPEFRINLTSGPRHINLAI